MTIKFRNEEHERSYRDLLSKMKSKDCYHKAAAYLLALDEVCNRHVSDLFDFEKDVIKPFGTLYLPWQTGTSVKTTRLMFNLWSGVSINLDKSESIYEETRCYYRV